MSKPQPQCAITDCSVGYKGIALIVIIAAALVGFHKSGGIGSVIPVRIIGFHFRSRVLPAIDFLSTATNVEPLAGYLYSTF